MQSRIAVLGSANKRSTRGRSRILERYADIRRTLRLLHKDIGDIGSLIAATALEHDLTLLSIDTDFDRVPHLKWKLVNLKKAA